MKNKLKTSGLFGSFLLSLILTLTYELKSNGYPSLLVFLSTLLLIFIFSKLTREKNGLVISVGGSVFLLFLSFPFASRGPSLSNAVFLISISVPLAFFLSGEEEKRATLFSFSAVFGIWALVGNWEFPSTFYPFVLYGWREIAFLSASFWLASFFAKKKELKLLLVIVSFLFIIFGLKIYFSMEATALKFFSETLNLKNFISVIILSMASYLFFSGLLSKENLSPFVFYRTVIFSPVFLTLYVLFGHLYSPRLPLPFNARNIFLAFGLIFALYLASFLNLRVLSKTAILGFPVLIFARFFAPAEANWFYFHGERYFAYSFGYEHFGPWFFLWLFLVAYYYNMKNLYLPALLSLSAIFSFFLYFTRAYNFLNFLPVEFFKDLGAEGVSWVKKPVLPGEPYLILVLTFIIISISVLISKKE